MTPSFESLSGDSCRKGSRDYLKALYSAQDTFERGLTDSRKHRPVSLILDVYFYDIPHLVVA